MKKAISLILVFVMMLSLCACGKKKTQATDYTTLATQEPTENTLQSTIGETDATQEATEEASVSATVVGSTPTTKPAAASTTAATTVPATKATTAATTAATTKATAVPTTVATTVATTAATTAATTEPATVPTTCNHDYIDGVCSVCGGAQANYKALDSGVWTAAKVVDGKLHMVELTFADAFFDVTYGADIHAADFDANFRNDLLKEYEQNKNALTVIDGVYYYGGSGDGGPITYTVSENAIQVECDGWLKISLERTAGDQLTITKCDEVTALVGIVLTWGK